jgi:hypothetical protein
MAEASTLALFFSDEPCEEIPEAIGKGEEDDEETWEPFCPAVPPARMAARNNPAITLSLRIAQAILVDAADRFERSGCA